MILVAYVVGVYANTGYDQESLENAAKHQLVAIADVYASWIHRQMAISKTNS